MGVYEHPEGGGIICGMQLVPGAILRPGDVYASTTGAWEECPCSGAMLGSVTSIWVRPEVDLSDEGLGVLTDLMRLGGDWCVAMRHRKFYRVPDPEWNWDERLDPAEITCGECIQELVDFGLLKSMICPVGGASSDYATVVWGKSENQVFCLTEAGRREVEQRLQ